MSEIYKVKHTPSGLYYQPAKSYSSQLSPRGKVYTSKVNGVDSSRDPVLLQIKDGSQAFKTLGELGYILEPQRWKSGYCYVRIPKSEFEKETIIIQPN